MIHKAKKSLGQNFLKSESALRAIIEAGEISLDDTILEIGPGKGALTKKLLEKSGRVVAVEKDRNLFDLLQEKFAKEISEKKLILVEGDILEFDINQAMQDVVEKSFAERTGASTSNFSAEKYASFRDNILHGYKIIANIPYNITGAILKKFLTEKNQPRVMVLMVQHEVAKRILARDGKESILSISVKAYGEPKIIMKVPARYFSPAPKVDSAVIAIKNISRKIFNGQGLTLSEEKFWEIVRAGFAHKRKKLTSNLKKIFPDVQHLGKWKNARAEDLKLEDWIEIASI